MTKSKNKSRDRGKERLTSWFAGSVESVFTGCPEAALFTVQYVPGTELGALRMRFHFFFVSGWKTGGLGSATSLVIEVWARHVFSKPQFSHL